MTSGAALETVVAVWQDLRATRARGEKTRLLAGLLGRLDPGEVPVVAAFLCGEPRQGRLGVGWATLRDLDAPPAAAPSLRVTEVDATLDRLTTESGPGSQARRRQQLTALFARATGDEQAFLRGLLLGELRQGALESLLADAVAHASGVPVTTVRRAVMFAGDVPLVAHAAMRGGPAAVEAIGLELFRPVSPMLAQTAASVAEALAGTAEAAVEDKLDGARIQVHRDGDRIAVYTRSLREITGDVPGVVAAVASMPATTLVLDGEALALDAAGRPRPFQESMRGFADAGPGPPTTPSDAGSIPPTAPSGAGSIPPTAPSDAGPSGDAAVRLQPFFFDVLHRDGRDLVDEPTRDRVAALAELVPARLRVGHRVVSEEAAAQQALTEALEAGHEGVVVKDLDAPYAAGRRGAAWVKVKPSHTLDLVVLAAEWGSGRRQGWLSNLHLGAIDPAPEGAAGGIDPASEGAAGGIGSAPEGAAGGLVMLGKTFKGLTDEMLSWQTQRLLELETRRAGHVVHVRPELVVEVAFDGVQTSSRYPGGVALRFARVKGYRPDKPASQADTIDTVRAIHAGRRPPVG